MDIETLYKKTLLQYDFLQKHEKFVVVHRVNDVLRFNYQFNHPNFQGETAIRIVIPLDEVSDLFFEVITKNLFFEVHWTSHPLSLEETPDWFQDLFQKANALRTKDIRLRRLFQ